MDVKTIENVHVLARMIADSHLTIISLHAQLSESQKENQGLKNKIKALEEAKKEG